MYAVWILKRIIAEGRKNGGSPLIETAEYMMLFRYMAKSCEICDVPLEEYEFYRERVYKAEK